MISLKLNLVVLKKTDCFVVGSKDWEQLATKAIQGAALPLESVDDVHGGDSLPLGVLSVGDSISDDVLQEDLENSTSLLIDKSRDPLDSSTAGQSPDGRLGDALDVVPQHLPFPSPFPPLPRPLMLMVYQQMMAVIEFPVNI